MKDGRQSGTAGQGETPWPVSLTGPACPLAGRGEAWRGTTGNGDEKEKSVGVLLGTRPGPSSENDSSRKSLVSPATY